MCEICLHSRQFNAGSPCVRFSSSFQRAGRIGKAPQFDGPESITVRSRTARRGRADAAALRNPGRGGISGTGPRFVPAHNRRGSFGFALTQVLSVYKGARAGQRGKGCKRGESVEGFRHNLLSARRPRELRRIQPFGNWPKRPHEAHAGRSGFAHGRVHLLRPALLASRIPGPEPAGRRKTPDSHTALSNS